jgi:hypothetical protein
MVVVPGRQATQPGEINSLESILEFLESFKISGSGYIAWWNRFLGINSWAPSKFNNSGSGMAENKLGGPFFTGCYKIRVSEKIQVF